MEQVSTTQSANPRPWLAEVNAPAAADDRQTLVREPDAATRLVFRTTSDQRSDLLVLGPRTRAAYHKSKTDLPVCASIRINPGRARILLGVPINNLVDQTVPVPDLWGDIGNRLTQELAAAGDDTPLVLKYLQAALTARLATQTPSELARSQLLHAAIDELSISTNAQPQQVRTVARQLGISERHLRNLFTSDVGLSPKHFARIDRVRTVVARARRKQLTQLAPETGYYDQSHMTAEFHDLMGVPPGAFITGHLPRAQHC